VSYSTHSILNKSALLIGDHDTSDLFFDALEALVKAFVEVTLEYWHPDWYAPGNL
jgi:hypothetical protein